MWNDDLVRQNGKTIWFIESQYASLKKTFEQQKSKRTGHVEQKKAQWKANILRQEPKKQTKTKLWANKPEKISKALKKKLLKFKTSGKLWGFCALLNYLEPLSLFAFLIKNIGLLIFLGFADPECMVFQRGFRVFWTLLWRRSLFRKQKDLLERKFWGLALMRIRSLAFNEYLALRKLESKEGWKFQKSRFARTMRGD